MDTVRVPVSVIPYEDPSMKHQRRLDDQQDGRDISEAADMDKVSVKTVSEASENSANPVNKTFISEEGAQRSENTSASSEAPKQD